MKADSKRRLTLIDEYRGLLIILVVLYHGAYDLVFIFGMNIPAFFGWPMKILQPILAGSFIFVSGISCHFSRNNLKRGCVIFGIGMLMTLGTLLFLPEQIIRFGILHCLGLCMILFAVLRPILKKIPPLPGMLVCVLLLIFTKPVSSGYFALGQLFIPLPAFLYETPYLFPLGFCGPGFYSSDYFSLIPWLFLFLTGSFFGVMLTRAKLPDWCFRPHIPPLAFIGRHTIYVYVFHQPVIYGLLLLILPRFL